MIYTVTFNPALDYVVSVEELVLGQVNRTSKEQIFFGGKGINVSFILSELGVRSTALGFIAGFTGKEIEHRVQAVGIHTSFIELDQGLSRINVKVHSTKETEFNGQGPDISSKHIDTFFRQLDLIETGDILVLAGSIPPSMPDDIYEKIMCNVSDKNLKVVVDATKDLLTNVLKHRPFLIKPNHHELGEIFQTTINTTDDSILYARELQRLGACNVLVSMAGDGAILLDEVGKVYTIGAPSGTVINSVGAGDSMLAGFLAGYLKTGDYEEALRLGIAAGSATTFTKGLATKAEIDRLLVL